MPVLFILSKEKFFKGMNIYLVGFMGSGKTSVGKELAKKKRWQFLDLDDFIELKEKRTISDIFAKEGQQYFRRIERKVLQEVSKENNFVIACGGGIVINPENIKTMKDTGKLICLSACPQVILERTSNCSKRPLLNVADPKKQIELLLKLRAPYYAEADKTIETSNLSVEQVASKIHKLFQAKHKTKTKKKAPRIIKKRKRN